MLVIFIVFMIGILFFIYWIPKKLGYPKVGKYLSIGLATLLVLIISYGIFKDAFFTKNQVRKLLLEHNLVLEDDFEILNNKTVFNIGEQYHRFRLEISENDKNRVVSEIKNSKDFKVINEVKVDLYSSNSNYKASKVFQNSEDEEMFAREYFRPNHEGGNSIYIKIHIEKSDNKLIFEEFKRN